MDRQISKIIFFACFFVFLSSVSHCIADEGVSKRLQAPDGITKWNISTGFFLPNEGDLDIGILIGFGFKYAKDQDTIFGDFYFSSTDPNISTSIGDVDNLILQMGYMTDFGEWEKSRVGAGMQIHQMDFGGTDIKKTRTTIFGVGEYDLSDNNWTVRFQSSQYIKNDSIRFGGYSLTLSYDI